jgi:signal transduction histidine kinase
MAGQPDELFNRARRRLALFYIGLFALIFGVFSVAFYLVLTIVLQPDFDIDADSSSPGAEQSSYVAATERIATALIIADVIVIGVVGVAAWLLADRTLRPIRDAHRRQRRFVADASHEIKTPVAAIRTTAEGALAASRPDDVPAALTSIVESTERLSRVANDLLLLARMDEPLLEPRREPFDLSVVVAESIETDRAARGGRPSTATFTPDLVVLGDHEEIGRIVANLLDNAYRYGGETVTVSVATVALDNRAIVEVSDDGPGVPREDLERIFEPFVRVARDASRPSGSGLGLAIAADLARRNHGVLSAGPRPGGGVTFRLSLPRFR